MKKYLKTAFFSIIIFYFIISVIFNFCIYFITKNQLKPYTEMLLSNGSIEIDHSFSTYDLMNISELSGNLKIVSQNIFILLVCILIGIIVGIIKVLKEFSKLKYLLYFILGYIIYIGILAVFIYFSNQIYNLDLFSMIGSIMLQFSLLYILFFFIVVAINMIIIKVQINKLNKSLNKN